MHDRKIRFPHSGGQGRACFIASLLLILGGLLLFIPPQTHLHAGQGAAAAKPANSLRIEPTQITLQGPGASHGLLISHLQPDGRWLDVTAKASITSSAPAIAAVGPAARVASRGDGQAMLEVQYAGQSGRIPVTVVSAAGPGEISFNQQIIPILTRFGCNQGSCHGKGVGQNGFRLSLRGYAPEWDHDWITREFLGRRIDRLNPAASLLLRKPAGQAPHEGGRVLDAGGPAYELLRAWIAADAPGPAKDESPVVKLELLGGERTLAVGQKQRLLVRAHTAAGEVRDVTWLSQFFSNEPSVVSVSEDGLVTGAGLGEGVVRVHFLEHVAVAGFRLPRPDASPAALYARRLNVVDEHVFNKLQALGIPPSGDCDDAAFLRRASLDATGTLPTPQRVRDFQADGRPDKRARLIDELLASPEYVDFWTQQFADLLQNRKERDHDVRGAKGVRAMHGWLRQRIADNRPWDEITRQVLTATGDAGDNPQIGYFVVTVGESGRAEESEAAASVAQAFLGTRIGCAKCHNHPLEKYTQDDYYHFAAFFSRMSFKRQEPGKGQTMLTSFSREEQDHLKRVTEMESKVEAEKKAAAGKSGKEAEQAAKKLADRDRELAEARKRLAEFRDKPPAVRQPRTGRMMDAQPLDRKAVHFQGGQDPRQALAGWITDPSNDYFSGNMVNRLWRHYMGVGLVEPVDDLRASNPPSNRELYDALRKEFVAGRFDMKRIMRLIMNSRAYQLSSATTAANELDRRWHSHYFARRLSAEPMLDAISQASGVPDKFAGHPVGTRAIQLADPSVGSYFLGLFGRSDRVTACACERNGEVTLPQLLHLQNGSWIKDKLESADGRLATLLKVGGEPDKMVQEICLATVSRMPRPAELQAVRQALEAGDKLDEVMKDLYWALLNSREFVFNH